MGATCKRHQLCWIAAVWWVLVGAVRAEYDSSSCSRQGRHLNTRPDLPCDLVKNNFCDSSGQDYPWMQVRKFVYENQGLIKRMYGNHKHYAILKEEMMETMQDGGHLHKPHEMYSPDALDPNTPPADTSHTPRESIRSNAFARTAKQFEIHFYLDEEEDSVRARQEYDPSGGNGRPKPSNSRDSAENIETPQHSGGRSISSSSPSNDKQKTKQSSDKNRLKDKNSDESFVKKGTIHISPSYTTKTSSDTTKSPSSTDPTILQSDGNANADQISKAELSDASAEVIPTTVDPPHSTDSSTSTEHSTQTPNAQDSQETTMRPSLTEEQLSSATESSMEQQQLEDVAKESLTDSVDESYDGSGEPLDAADYPGDEPSSTTEGQLSTSGPRPPRNSSQEQSTDSEHLDSATTPHSLYDEQQYDLGSLEQDELHTSSSLPLEKRTSDGVSLDEDNSNDHRTTMEVTAPDSFKFPNEIDEESRPETGTGQGRPHKIKIKNNNRRLSNTRRPASGESRQPSNIERNPGVQWNVAEESELPDQPSPPVVSGGKVPQRGQTVWRRPNTEKRGPNSSSEPTPPMPSTVPTPAPTPTYKKGVNACPVETDVVAPYWANNTRGEVLALLNLSPFEQYVHWEKCRFEYRQMYCRPGCRCEQQYRLHRMLAFDPSNDCRGIFSDWFRFPSGCVCKCYDLPEEVTNTASHYSRRSRVSVHGEPEDGGGKMRGRSLGNEEVPERAGNELSDDLTNVFFENEEDLYLPSHAEAEERMDGHISDEQYEENGENFYDMDEDDNIEDIESVLQSNIEEKNVDEAVLEGEPVHSLYSRVENLQNRNQPAANIAPQRRPRPYVIRPRVNTVHQPLLLAQKHSYNVRFANPSRMAQYSPPSGLTSRYNYRPSRHYNHARQRYLTSRLRTRNINSSWNPQASFPSALSNPRFDKYIEKSSVPKGRSVSYRTHDGSNNLNYNHLMKPSPSSIAVGSMSAPVVPEQTGVTVGTMDVHTPHYFFNLTSHLLRTQQLDSRRPVTVYKSREPRSASSADDSTVY